MARLIARTPAEGLCPVTAGGIALTEATLGPMTSIAVQAGQAGPLSAALEQATGADLPGPGETRLGRDGARVIWFGAGHVLLTGIAPPDLPGVPMTDQSDGWCALHLKGAGARDVLARLTPIDLRDRAFAEGTTARTLLNHMQSSVTRLGLEAFLILVFRSMAGTAVHEIATAMRLRAARMALPPDTTAI